MTRVKAAHLFGRNVQLHAAANGAACSSVQLNPQFGYQHVSGIFNTLNKRVCTSQLSSACDGEMLAKCFRQNFAHNDDGDDDDGSNGIIPDDQHVTQLCTKSA